MDEPQIPAASEPSEGEKQDIDEVLDEAFASDQLEKPMEVDEPFPATSATPMPETIYESNQLKSGSDEVVESTTTGESISIEDATKSSDDTIAEINETIEQVNFEKTNESTLDESINFTEKSINISQITVENQDDSNDAFNALKRDEIDALNEMKLEAPEHDDKPESEVPMETDELIPSSLSPPAAASTQNQEEEPEKVTEDPSTEDVIVSDENTPKESVEIVEKATDNEIETQTENLEITNEEENADKDEMEVEKETEEEEEETETTNEGEGVDENICLLGDAEERELTEADKERVIQTQEISEEEESVESSSVVGEKEASGEQEGTEEVMEVDGEEQESEVVEKEIEPEIEEVEEEVPLKENEIREIPENEVTEETCLNCENTIKCCYRLLEENGEIRFLCSYNCIKDHREDNPDKYSLTQKKIYIYEQPPVENLCSKCGETKSCKYHYRFIVVSTITKDPPPPPEVPEGEEAPAPEEPVTETIKNTETKYICEETCLKDFVNGNDEKFILKEIQRRSTRVREAPKVSTPQDDDIVVEQEVPKIVARTDQEVEAAKIDRDESFIRRCAQCCSLVNFQSKTIQWETLDFCNEKCLGSYQNFIGSTCASCQDVVSMSSIGKLCVRFGFDLRQFCSTKCLDEYKKSIKHCALCQQDLSEEENVIIAKVGEKKIYKDFCNQQCLNRYEQILNPKKKQPPFTCSVCNNKKPVKIEVAIDDAIHRFCSNPCFSAFKFVNNVVPDECDMCTRHFERKSTDAHTIYQNTQSKIFCSKICMNMYICKQREIWQCNWCKVSKYSFDMVQMNFGNVRMCSLNCLSLSEVSNYALSQKRNKCSHCRIMKQPQYHLTMSDATIRQFCTYQCAIGFQSQFKNSETIFDVVPAGIAKRIKPSIAAIQNAEKNSVPVISRVQSLNLNRRSRGPYNPITNRSRSPIPVPEITVQLERLSDLPSRVKIHGPGSSWTPIASTSSAGTSTRVEHKTQVVTIPPLPNQVANKSTMCKAITLNKAIQSVPNTCEAECQTEDFLEKTYILPVPIPVYIPQPMYMYNLPTPIPVPIPLPIPVPVFIPTTRNSANGIMKEIKKIQDKMPTDPYEAELLMMAEMVAGDRKREQTDSDSEEENEIEYGDGIENNASFNEDLVQMAFKMASGNDFDDPPVDLENEMTANTISQNAHGYDEMDPQALHHQQLLLLHQQQRAAEMQSNRGRKRMPAPVKQQNNTRNSAPNKRIKREMEVMQPEMPREPAEKPDANMCLKYTFGVNAWKQWVATKNADLEKSSIRRKPIKSEILQLTADELNYSLCMFVKEVRKPNGSEYAPDTIYYLVLGIQQYLYENGRIDNIFTDRYYEQFTDCLDEVAKKFSVLYNDSQYIVTRVEEEHLWECKQLGAHSPHVLLSTLMFFNTKHFNLVTVDEHMELSFSHIMKHWKRNPNQPGAAKMPGSRNVLLRFYPPQSSLEANSRKKKVYEQQENEENPLRCPVKLYEFYLSKCPESVKTRNDVFYLQPERSCVPDSPVWYSTQALSRDALSKMLHRVKMVKEINIALLTS